MPEIIDYSSFAEQLGEAITAISPRGDMPGGWPLHLRNMAVLAEYGQACTRSDHIDGMANLSQQNFALRNEQQAGRGMISRQAAVVTLLRAQLELHCAAHGSDMDPTEISALIAQSEALLTVTQ